MHYVYTHTPVFPTEQAGVKVSYARGMDLLGEIHYDWPLESALEVNRDQGYTVLTVLLWCCWLAVLTC